MAAFRTLELLKASKQTMGTISCSSYTIKVTSNFVLRRHVAVHLRPNPVINFVYIRDNPAVNIEQIQ